MKINLVKVSIVLVALLLFQWWLMSYSVVPFAEFSDQNRVTDQISNQDQIVLKKTNEVIWYFSGWVPDSIERKFYQFSRVRQNIINLGGSSLIDEDVPLLNIPDFIIYAPRAFQLGLLGPLPRFWTGEGSSSAMTMARKIVGVTTIFYYICLVGLIKSIQMFWRNPGFLAIIVICISAIMLYSYTHPNTGALLRYRYVFYMLLVSFGLAYVVQRLQIWIKSRDDRKKVL